MVILIQLKKLNIPLVKVVRCQSKEMVDMRKFWEWAEENKKQLNFAKFEKGALGKEPDWVDEKRKLDYKNPTKHSKKCRRRLRCMTFCGKKSEQNGK